MKNDVIIFKNVFTVSGSVDTKTPFSEICVPIRNIMGLSKCLGMYRLHSLIGIFEITEKEYQSTVKALNEQNNNL